MVLDAFSKAQGTTADPVLVSSLMQVANQGHDSLGSQVRLLARLVPQWCTLVRVNDAPAVKLDASVRFGEVQRALKVVAAKGELPAESEEAA